MSVGPKPEPFSAPETTVRPAVDINDIDRAERFIEFLDGSARYVPQHKKWMLWNSERWVQDENGGQIIQQAIAFTKERVDAANEIKEPKEQQKAWMAAKMAGGQAKINAMVNIASSYPGISTHVTEFDSDPWLFGVANGVYDLKNNEFRPARPEDLIWKRSPVAYDPDAKCPMFLEFLNTIMPDASVRAFLQRAQGYSMTANVTEQVLFFLYGSGQNGKSTYIDTMEKMMGDYSWRSNAKLFLDDKFGGDPANLLASLPEMRMVVGAEVGDAPLAETRVKDLTGGDKLNACRKYCEAFTFRPTHKLWFYGNDRPTIRNNDDGIWRRMCLIPFTVKIPDAKRDFGINDRLWTEAPGILNWMIEGCRQWQRNGLQKPAAITVATQQYREAEDSLGEFLAEECDFVVDGFTKSGVLFNAYALWCESRGVPKNRQLGEKKIAARLLHAKDENDVNRVSEARPTIEGRKYRGFKGIVLYDPAVFQRKVL